MRDIDLFQQALGLERPWVVRKAEFSAKEGLFAWFRSGIADAMLEAMSSLIQAAKARACGYRNSRNLIAISYLIGGELRCKLPM